MSETLIFFKIVFFGSNILVSVSFLLVENPQKLFFLYSVKLSSQFSTLETQKVALVQFWGVWRVMQYARSCVLRMAS